MSIAWRDRGVSSGLVTNDLLTFRFYLPADEGVVYEQRV
jgi:hypothetical protein